jgi:hypothetical protein
MARQIILSGPAKIGADWRMPGWSGEVDDDIADQLAASGVRPGQNLKTPVWTLKCGSRTPTSTPPSRPHSGR